MYITSLENTRNLLEWFQKIHSDRIDAFIYSF